MAVNYLVRAEVVDLRRDTPRAADRLFVDANVWLWQTYTRLSLHPSPPPQQKVERYTGYLKAALSAGATLFRSELSLAEMAHVIERTEREIYERKHPDLAVHIETVRKNTWAKEYRSNYADERKRVVEEVSLAWAQVQQLSSSVDFVLDKDAGDEALSSYTASQLDGYDPFILVGMRRALIPWIITDDGDFLSVPDIVVVTERNVLIDAARDQGKLFRR